MNAKQFARRAIAAAAFAGLVGCATSGPASTGQAPQPNAPAPQRQLLALDEGLQPVQSLEEAKRLVSQLPQRISAEDAKTMLVQIDPAKIVTGEGKYELQRWRGGHRGHGGWRGYGWRGYGWRGYGGLGGLYGGLGYLRFGGLYWPYASYGSYYAPLTYAGAYPYLFGYRGLYRPYSFLW